MIIKDKIIITSPKNELFHVKASFFIINVEANTQKAGFKNQFRQSNLKLVVFLSWNKLIEKFNISLIKITYTYPKIPFIGKKTQINDMLTNKSRILQSIIPTCLFSPFKMQSTMLSK